MIGWFNASEVSKGLGVRVSGDIKGLGVRVSGNIASCQEDERNGALTCSCGLPGPCE